MEATTFAIRGLLCALALLFVAARADAAIYAVGSEPGCTHATIQEAVDAAEANPEEDFIRIPHSRVWDNQAVVIDTDQTLWLEGFWSDCNTIDFSQQTVLDGAGGPASSVMRIDTGANGAVRMSWLTLRGGDPSVYDGKGGGIHFSGRGRLEPSNDMAVINNSASSGGGIYADGDIADAQLVIGARVTIAGNTASRDGGGVFVNGMTLTMNEPDTLIAFNEAQGELGSTGYGGGLVIRSTGDKIAQGYVGSSGLGGAGVIYGNTAKRGGGIAVSAGSDATDRAQLFLRSSDPAVPVAVRGNFASEYGGAIYAWPNKNFSSEAPAEVFVMRAEISDNAAPQGAVAYADNSNVSTSEHPIGGWMTFGTGDSGAASCGPAAYCVHVFGNATVDASGTATTGALFYLDDSSRLDMGRMLIEGNQAGRVVQAYFGNDGSLDMADSLVVGNTLQAEIIWSFYVLGSGGSIDISDSTFAGNSIGVADLITAYRSTVHIDRSILWQPGHTMLNTLGGESGTPDVFRVIASEVDSLGDGSGIAIVAEPRFVDPARGDYRLRAASPAVDFAPPVDGDDFDALGLPRDQRIGAIPRSDPSESRDIGAFERQGLQPLVLNGEFAGDTNLWFLPVGHAGNFQVNNAPGSPDGTGSAQVAGTSGDGHLYGYMQCIHLPGPGTYALNGSARTEGDPQLANPTALIWDLRSDGGEGCIDGAIAQSGAQTFDTQATTDQWTRPATPAYVTVPEGMWNHNTSLTVFMAVYPNASDNGGYNGLFDHITLDWSADGSDVIFADDFDGP